MLKTCTKCKILKEIVEFSKDKSKKDGFCNWCKVCTNEKSSAHYYNNSKEQKAAKLKWKLDNYEKNKNINKKYRDSHKKESKEYHSKRYIKNKDKILEYSKNYYRNNLDAVKIKHKEYALSDIGKIALTNSRQNRRMRINRASNGTLPVIIHLPLSRDLQEALQEQHGKCAYCGCHISHDLQNIHLDHIIPLSKNGIHTIHNLQWLCATCNLQKSNKIISYPLIKSIVPQDLL